MAVRVQVQRFADWDGVRRMLDVMPSMTKKAIRTALFREAEKLRSIIQVGIRNQAPGGRPFSPALSKFTLAGRRIKGGKKRGAGTKTMIVEGDLLRNIATTKIPGGFFVGIRRGKRRGDGRELVRIAAVQEFGYGPIVIPITKKMAGFLAALFKEAGKSADGPAGSSAGTGKAGIAGHVVVTIRPRPFMVPGFKVWSVVDGGLRARLPAGISDELQRRLAKKKISPKYIRGPGMDTSFRDLRLKRI